LAMGSTDSRDNSLGRCSLCFCCLDKHKKLAKRNVMTWQWVVLIIGIVAILSLLLGYVTWAHMRLKMFELTPHTVPDLFKSLGKETKRAPSDEDTIVAAEALKPVWPGDFTGDEDAAP
jgi:hypothetical protein